VPDVLTGSLPDKLDVQSMARTKERVATYELLGWTSSLVFVFPKQQAGASSVENFGDSCLIVRQNSSFSNSTATCTITECVSMVQKGSLSLNYNDLSEAVESGYVHEIIWLAKHRQLLDELLVWKSMIEDTKVTFDIHSTTNKQSIQLGMEVGPVEGVWIG